MINYAPRNEDVWRNWGIAPHNLDIMRRGSSSRWPISRNVVESQRWGLAENLCLCCETKPYPHTTLTELSLNQTVLVASERFCFHILPSDIFRYFLYKIFHISFNLVQKYGTIFTKMRKICTETFGFIWDDILHGYYKKLSQNTDLMEVHMRRL
jgi:hypothetical protein